MTMSETETVLVAEDTRMAWWGSRAGIVIAPARWPRQERTGPRRPEPPAERPAAG